MEEIIGLVFGLFLTMLICATLLITVNYFVGRNRCEYVSDKLALESEYSFVNGCYVKYEDTWVKKDDVENLIKTKLNQPNLNLNLKEVE